MKKNFFITLLLIIIAIFAYADYFQIIIKSDNDMIYVAYAAVKVIDGDKVVFEGYTDKYGRIIINLPHREYEGKVLYRKQWRKIRLNIDGSENLKVIYLK